MLACLRQVVAVVVNALTDYNNEPVVTSFQRRWLHLTWIQMVQLFHLNLYQLVIRLKEGDVYTYSIVDLTRFNERYNTNYYTRVTRICDSTDTTVEKN